MTYQCIECSDEVDPPNGTPEHLLKQLRMICEECAAKVHAGAERSGDFLILEDTIGE